MKMKIKVVVLIYPSEPLMVIVEFCAYGDLQSYLRHCRGVEDKYYQDLYKVPADKLGSRDLLSFAIQTARGMAHLAGMKVRVIYGGLGSSFTGVFSLAVIPSTRGCNSVP